LTGLAILAELADLWHNLGEQMLGVPHTLLCVNQLLGDQLNRRHELLKALLAVLPPLGGLLVPSCGIKAWNTLLSIESGLPIGRLEECR
jgi:hypothetical protein